MSLENEIVDYFTNAKDIEHWATLKGEYRYLDIVKFLKSKNIETTWDNVDNYVRYDKRLLINSFKYIVFLEEMYKSFVVKFNGEKKTKVLSSNFEYAYRQYLLLGDKAKFDGIDLKLMKEEKSLINSFRNKVTHNKILINSTFGGKSLEDILNIFVRILPRSYRQGFVKDINNCANNLVNDLWHIELFLEK